MRFFSLCTLALGLLTGSLYGQSAGQPFERVPATPFLQMGRPELPSALETFETDFTALEQVLRQAPREHEAHRFSLTLPVVGGRSVDFAVWQIDIMHPDLGARYPEIQTYAGEALDGSGRMVRITTAPTLGLHALFLLPDGRSEHLEPWASGMNNAYVLYDSRNVAPPANLAASACGVDDHDITHDLNQATQYAAAPRGSAAPVPLRIYRFACATTGGYAQDNGGTVSSALASVVNKVNQINAPIERDVALRLQLIPQNDQIIFLNDNTDPYTGTDLSNWISENVLVLNTTIGSSAYDLGHVIGRGTGSGVIGLASLSSACTVIKASGASSGQNPYGLFFIGTFAHEVGHQLSATHTYNFCPPNDATSSTAYEPASGSTIMSYGGVCGGQNVVNPADLYYHNISVQQMRNFTTDGTGGSCGTLQTTTNNSPTATAVTPDSLYLPISTPFELKGAGSDPDGDVLTYCWEQFDLGQPVPLGTEGTNSPLLRSYPPASSPNRIFPQMPTIVSNQNDEAEILPTQTRKLDFRLTVRDNNPQSGGIDWDNLRLLVTNQAGPFLVQNPNAGSTVWTQGAYTLVTWDVANTDQAPVNCAAVNIRLSTDGGFTYPIELASDVANTGSAYVLAPAGITTNSARVKVEAADNVFFDISNANFRIAPPQTAGFTMGLSATKEQICLPASFTADILTSSLLGFNETLQLEVLSGLPPGAVSVINPTVINPGQSATLNLDLNNVTTNGDFPIVIRASGLTDTALVTLSLTLRYNDYQLLALTGPADGSGGVQQTPVLQWAAVPGVAYYELELATNPGFGAGDLLINSTNIPANSFQVTNILNKGGVYYWRVRAHNPPCSSEWTTPYVFAVGVDQCSTFVATDLPKNISASGAVNVESNVVIPAGTVVSDVNVRKLSGFHENFQHLNARLISPLGTEVILYSASCANFNGSFQFGFDDAATTPLSCPPSNDGDVYRPQQSLSAFNNQDGGGQWTLRLRDVLNTLGGQFAAFELEICSSVSLNGPMLINNKALTLPGGNNAGIGNDLLKTEDGNNGPDQLVYTLMTTPRYGHLEKNWGGPLAPGAQFTQSDLDNGALRFFDYGNNPTGQDNFRFSVTDNEGGLVTGNFIIQPLVSTGGTSVPENRFGLAPNPGAGHVQVIFEQALPLESTIRVYAADGRLMWQQQVAPGAENAWITLNDAPDGVYIVQVQNRESAGVRRWVIRH